MNPSIEVQINARLDKLDAGLKVAEAKINESASKMGNAGDKAGSAFVNKMVGNMVKGLAMGAVTNILGGGILNAVKGINAGDSGEKIGMDIAKGIVDGAKGIPIVGIFVSIFDEIINGAARVADALSAAMGAAFVGALKKYHQLAKDAEDVTKSTIRTIEDVQVSDSPEAKIRLEAARKKEARIEQINKMEAETMAAAARTSDPGAQAAMERETQKIIKKLREDAANEAVAIDKKRDSDIKKLNEQTLKDKVAEQEKAAEVEVKRLQKLYDEHVAETIAEEKRVQEEKLQAQQDIIDAEQAAQAQISKVGRVDQMAGEAARGMINSGQTALGQFNFAQEGAAGQAMTLAQKQVASLEKIEAATAEMVRLEKEGGGFR